MGYYDKNIGKSRNTWRRETRMRDDERNFDNNRASKEPSLCRLQVKNRKITKDWWLDQGEIKTMDKKSFACIKRWRLRKKPRTSWPQRKTSLDHANGNDLENIRIADIWKQIKQNATGMSYYTKIVKLVKTSVQLIPLPRFGILFQRWYIE